MAFRVKQQYFIVYDECLHKIEGSVLYRKGVQYIAFWVDFHFIQDQAIFWQTDLFGHEKKLSVIVFDEPALFLRNKTQFPKQNL